MGPKAIFMGLGHRDVLVAQEKRFSALPQARRGRRCTRDGDLFIFVIYDFWISFLAKPTDYLTRSH